MKGETRKKLLGRLKRVAMDIEKREPMDTLLISVTFEDVYIAGSTCFCSVSEIWKSRYTGPNIMCGERKRGEGIYLSLTMEQA